MGHPRGSEVVPLDCTGMISYWLLTVPEVVYLSPFRRNSHRHVQHRYIWLPEVRAVCPLVRQHETPNPWNSVYYLQEVFGAYRQNWHFCIPVWMQRRMGDGWQMGDEFESKEVSKWTGRETSATRSILWKLFTIQSWRIMAYTWGKMRDK